MTQNDLIQTYQCYCDGEKNPWRIKVTVGEVKKFGIPKCPNCQKEMEFFRTTKPTRPKQYKYKVVAVKAGKVLDVTKMEISKGIINVLWYQDGHHTRWTFVKDVDSLTISKMG